MQENEVVRKAPVESIASLNKEEINLNEIKITANGTDDLSVDINKKKKHAHESCKGCDGICCKKDKKATD